MATLARETADGGPALLIGAPWRGEGGLHNAALLLDHGEVTAVRFKHDLPNYGVFDEKRVFAPGPLPGPMNFRGVRLGVMVCEDMWTGDVTECLEESGAEMLVVLNGSPFETDKGDERLNLAVARVGESGLPLIYVNQVCGQDELVFDGASFVLQRGPQAGRAASGLGRSMSPLPNGGRAGRMAGSARPGPIVPAVNGLEAIYQAP